MSNFETETIHTSEEYIEILEQADQEWEAKSKTKEWTFEVLKDPRLRTRPSERERNIVLTDAENNRTTLLKYRGVRVDTRKGYVFEKVMMGENKFTEFWTKGTPNE